MKYALHLQKVVTMINYGGGITKTNKSIKDMNKNGKFLMGAREMPAVKASAPSSKSKKKKK